MPEASLFYALLTQTWQVAVVGLVVWLIARQFTADRPHFAHALWMLVLIKAITPPIWSCPSSPFSWLAMERPTAYASAPHDPTLSRPTEQLTQQEAKSFPAATSAPLALDESSFNDSHNGHPSRWSGFIAGFQWNGKSLDSALSFIWLLGAGGGLLILVLRYAALLRTLRTAKTISLPGIDAVASQLSRKLGIRRRVKILILENQIGPVVLGLINPTIVLPAVVAKSMTPAEISMLLAHELTHLKRGDLWWALVQSFAKHLLWFHPLVHWAERCVTREAERSCDEETVTALNCNPVDYARCLLKVLEHKHQLHSVSALPGVRPVDITSARLERVMRLRKGSHQSGSAMIWLVLLLGCILILPGAGLSLAQEESATKPDVESKQHQEPNRLNPSVLPIATGPFGRFQQSVQRFSAATQSSPQTPVTLKTTLYSLSRTEANTLGVTWSNYRDWSNDETGLTQKLLDSQKEMVLVYNNPTKYVELDPAAYENLLQQINQNQQARVTSVPTVTTKGSPIALLSGVESEFEAGTVELANRPNETRTVVRTFKTGLDLRVNLKTVGKGKLSLGSNFLFSDVENVAKLGTSKTLSKPKAKPNRPTVVMKFLISQIECSIDKRLALLVADEDEKSWLAIYEFAHATEGEQDAVVLTGFHAEPGENTSDKVAPSIVVSCKGDDPTNLDHCRTVKYFGNTMAVTKNVHLDQKDGQTTVSGSNLTLNGKGRVFASADEGELSFSDDGQTYSMKLTGNAKFWSGETILNQADEITSSVSPQSQTSEYRGAVRITSAEPIYSGDGYASPDITADRVWVENGVVINCSGNVRIVEKSVDGTSTTTEAEEVRLLPDEIPQGLTKKIKIEIVKSKKD